MSVDTSNGANEVISFSDLIDLAITLLTMPDGASVGFDGLTEAAFESKFTRVTSKSHRFQLSQDQLLELKDIVKGRLIEQDLIELES